MSVGGRIPSLLEPGVGLGGLPSTAVEYKVSSNTNSNDPESVNSRVFVGGLNTLQMTKMDVAAIFKRYGRVTAVSMHKGFAFVQFMDPMEARQAVLGEDQRVYANQPIDVNIVSEPKHLHQQKKIEAKVTTTEGGTGAAETKSLNIPDSSQMIKYDEPDLLVCGTCKLVFQVIEDLAEHKSRKCALRTVKNPDAPSELLCATCLQSCDSAWVLVQHLQTAHSVILFSDYAMPNQQVNGMNGSSMQ